MAGYWGHPDWTAAALSRTAAVTRRKRGGWENALPKDTDDSQRDAAPLPRRTTMTDRFILEKHDHVMWLKLNRPERLNAMTIESWGELDEHLAAIDADRDVRCLVLAGERRAFLAGHDVGEIREHNEDIESGKLGQARAEVHR